MKSPPFAHRRPMFVGDDTTDESVFAGAPTLGGLGYSVERFIAGANGTFNSPARRPLLARAPLRPRRKAIRNERFRARSRGHRQWPHGRVAGTVVAPRVVVLSALRRRSGVLPAAGGRRGKGLLRRRARRHGRLLVRLCAQHRGRFDGPDRSQGRRGQDHGFRAALSRLRPDLPSASTRAHHRARRRNAADHHTFPADQSIRHRDAVQIDRQQSHHVPRRPIPSSGSPPMPRCPISTAKRRSC